jgi:hypothetical protein
MEKLVYVENCMVCGLVLGDSKNELISSTIYTQIKIFQLIGESKEI